MYLYAIKELSTGLFVNKYDNIEPLGVLSLLFSNAEQARLRISYEDSEGFIRDPLKDNIVWNLLEKKYRRDRWHINPTKEEIQKLKDSLDFKVVKVCLIDVEEID